ncbi:hypothetical protein SUGI_0957560 [Cryptomeria japonica]|nr:hypothetical protein SUGI_0957560 [Cryptomeria japonica]
MAFHHQELDCPRHKHKLVWFSPGERYKCSGCKENGGKGGYKCTLESCNDFRLHRDCAKLPDVLNSIHIDKELDFRPRSKISVHNCRACQNPVKGFLFEVPGRRRSTLRKPKIKRSLRFHPLCIALPESFTCTKHRNHSLKLVKGLLGHPSQDQDSPQEGNWRGFKRTMGDFAVKVAATVTGGVIVEAVKKTKECDCVDMVDGAIRFRAQLSTKGTEREKC